MRKTFLILSLGVSWMLWCSALLAEWPQTPMPVEITTSPEDTEYLRQIMTDAFRSVYYYRNPNTGLTSDFPGHPDANELIKTEHFFLTLTSIAIAGKIGLLSETKAAAEVEKMLFWIEKIPRAKGFFWGLIHPIDASLGPLDSEYTTIFGLSDFGWCYSALATVGEAYPQFKPRTEALLNAVHWSALYHRGSGLHGVVKFKTNGTISSYGVIRDVGTDCRVGVFMAIAYSQLPPSYWTEVLERHYVTRYGMSYLKPGEAMGYGEQPMALGYFLDQRGSAVGLSDANLGWGQICYAQDMEFPAWGWSSCLDMDGYLGWGNHKTRSWSRINTHAVAAQVVFYPNQVAKNFRAMEKLGLKQPITAPSGQILDFGFRDSIDVDSSETPEVLLPGLDQNIVFLSLANYLHNGVVWKYFMRNEKVQHGIEVIDEYRNPKKENLALFQDRDRNGPRLKPKPDPRPAELLVDNFRGTSNALGQTRALLDTDCDPGPEHARLRFHFSDDQLSNLTEPLNNIDLTAYNALKLVVRAEERGQIMVTMRLGNEAGYIPVDVTTSWSEVVIPFRSFLMGKDPIQFGNPDLPMRWTAMWHNRSHAQEIALGPQTLTSVDLRSVAFLSLPPEDIRSAALQLRNPASMELGADGVVDTMEAFRWTISGNSPESWGCLTVRNGNSLEVNYSIAGINSWITIGRNIRLELAPEDRILFYFKNRDNPICLEVKVVDVTGATFLYSQENLNTHLDWVKIEIPARELHYGWGGVKKSAPGKITRMEFALVAHDPTSGLRTSGQAWFKDLKILH